MATNVCRRVFWPVDNSYDISNKCFESHSNVLRRDSGLRRLLLGVNSPKRLFYPVDNPMSLEMPHF